jgi:hypothetical protein
MMTKTKIVRITRGLPAGPRPRVVISTDQVDAEKDRVMQAGLSFRDHLRVTFSHDYRALPVGLVTAIHRFPHRTEAEFEWFDNDEAAARVRNIYDQGGLDASIGFHVQDAIPNDVGGLDYRRARVIEFALTAVPANEGAVALVKSLGDDAVLELEDDDDPGDEGILVEPNELRAALTEGLGEVVAREVGHEVRYQAGRLWGAAEEECLVLAEGGDPEDDLVLVDEDLGQLVGSALAAIVGREVRAAVNALRGRVD